MRVIGGELKGRRLFSPKGGRGSTVRPTPDRVREAVFNILPRSLAGVRVLDLFAGTGAMGIEALSRGALEAVFVDADKSSADLVAKNLEACGLAARARVIRKDVPGALKAVSGPFGLVILDPPYGTGLLEEALKDLDASGLVAPGATVVAESATRTPLDVDGLGLECLALESARKYGDTTVYFFTAAGAGQQGRGQARIE